MSAKGYILFDLDNTLIDSHDSICFCIQETLKHLQHPIPDTVFFQRYRACTPGILFSAVNANYCADIPMSHFKAVFDSIYINHCLDHVSSIPKGIDFLTVTRKLEFCPVIMTNKIETAAKQICSVFFPNIFEVIIGRTGTTPIKQKESATKALDDNDINLDNCHAFVGDSYADRQCAQSLGITFVDILSTDVNDYRRILSTFSK